MFKDLVRQFNIIKALAIHDLQGQMRGYNYAFAWMLLEPLFYIVGFRMARKFLGGGMSNPSGMTPLVYYTLGVFTLYIFMAGMGTGRSAANKSSLLYFPRVTQIDAALGKGISTLAINLLMFAIIVTGAAIYEGVLSPENLNAVFFALFMSWGMGVGVGLVFSGIVRVFPPIKQFMMWINFGLRMSAGMFFCMRDVPPQYWPYLDWNPVLHATEMARDGWFETYTSPVASPIYMIECTLGLLLFGLSIERFMRRIPYV